MYPLTAIPGYKQREGANCYPYRDPKNENLSDALKRCDDEQSCAMVLDDEGKNQTFFLCDNGATIEYTTFGDRIYTKGRYLLI